MCWGLFESFPLKQPVAKTSRATIGVVRTEGSNKHSSIKQQKSLSLVNPTQGNL